MPADDALKRLSEALPSIVKGAAQEAIVMLSGFVGQQFGSRAVTADYKQGKTGIALGSSDRKNKGSRLRIAQGRLMQSFMLNGNGKGEHIQQITGSDGAVGIRYGSKVPYAAIHEYGGTINHPGGTAYFMAGEGRIGFVSNAKATSDMPRTKPHAITIPARAYLGPALIAFNNRGLPVLEEQIMGQINRVWETA
jgi:phage gpG-like protein